MANKQNKRFDRTGRIAKFERSVSNPKESSLVDAYLSKIKLLSIFSILYGYMVLLSYTMPFGFVPVASIESLPLLLFGFLFMSLLFIIFSFLLGWPVGFVFLRKELYELLQLKGNKEDVVFMGVLWLAAFILWLIIFYFFPSLFVIVLISIVACKFRNPSVFVGSAVLMTWLIVFLVEFDEFPLKELFLLAWAFFVFFLVLLPYLPNFKRGKRGDKFISFFMLSIILFIIVPVIPSYGSKGFTPNPFVKEGLAIIGIGGERIVSILSSQKGDVTKGKLLFYDGRKAWVKECVLESDVSKLAKNAVEDTKSNKTVTEVVVSKIKYLGTDVRCVASNKVNDNE